MNTLASVFNIAIAILSTINAVSAELHRFEGDGRYSGRFFLTLQLAAVILAATLVLGERPSSKVWIGILMVIAGVTVIGY